MDAGRAREIQTALIRENYLTGEATGEWNQQSQEAMRNYQAAHHWQTKIIPDSRALIGLGLGPNIEDGKVASASASNSSDTSQKAAKPTEQRRTGSSSALTLADAHSILN